MAHVTVTENLIIAVIIALFVTVIEHLIACAFVDKIESKEAEKSIGSTIESIAPLELHPLLRNPML